MSRCRQWRIHLGVFPPSAGVNGEFTEAQEVTCIQQTRVQYHELLQQHPFPMKQEAPSLPLNGKEATTEQEKQQQPPNSTYDFLRDANSVDPLTAMMMEEESKKERLQEMDRQYRKEQAKRRTNGGRYVPRQHVFMEPEDYDETAVTLQIIDRDLERLPPTALEPPERIVLLRQVLFVFHCSTYPAPGYRQGMHEIASHILTALELELTMNQNGKGGNYGAVDYSDEAVAADVFALLNAILDPLQPAFDCSGAGAGGTTANEKQPMAALGRRILQVTGRYHPTLLECLQRNVQVPPQLYLTKWIRLVYSRELATPETQLLPFWDSLFAQAAAASTVTKTTISTADDPTVHGSINNNLLQVLEAAAAARLLLHGHIILQSEDALHYCMNVPPQTPDSMAAWQKTTSEILQGCVTLSCIHNTMAAIPASPSPPISPLQQQQQQQHSHHQSSSLSSYLTTSTSWNHPRTAEATTDPLQSILVRSGGIGIGIGNDNNEVGDGGNSRPLLSSFSASLKSTLQQAKSKTLSLSNQIYQEWEKAGQQQQQSLPPSPQTLNSPYNIFYRDDNLQSQTAPPWSHQQQEQKQVHRQHHHHVQQQSSPSRSSLSFSLNDGQPALYDPHVMPGVHVYEASGGGDGDGQHQRRRLEWQYAMQNNATIVQSYLTHLQQQQGIVVPPSVWQAMAELQALAIMTKTTTKH